MTMARMYTIIILIIICSSSDSMYSVVHIICVNDVLLFYECIYHKIRSVCCDVEDDIVCVCGGGIRVDQSMDLRAKVS